MSSVWILVLVGVNILTPADTSVIVDVEAFETKQGCEMFKEMTREKFMDKYNKISVSCKESQVMP